MAEHRATAPDSMRHAEVVEADGEHALIWEWEHGRWAVDVALMPEAHASGDATSREEAIVKAKELIQRVVRLALGGPVA